MEISAWDKHQESLNKEAKFEHFPVGTRVKIICTFQDFYFFRGETGIVERNSGQYLDIIVRFDEPREFESGYIQKTFNFAPSDLMRLDEVKKCPTCGKEDYEHS